MSFNKQELIERYIELRDKKKAIMDEAKKVAASIDEELSATEAQMLAMFNEEGVNSVSTDAGTAYRAQRTSATVADWEVLLDHVQQNDLWGLLEKRVNKKAVEEYKEETEDLPPGVNWRSEYVVNIRRS